MDPGLESKVRLVSAITTLLQNAPDLGNSQLKVVSIFKRLLNFLKKKISPIYVDTLIVSLPRSCIMQE